MSSRRKSSNPCMVRVVNEEQKEPEEAMDIESSADKSKSSERIQVNQQEETLESWTVMSPQENQNSEPSEQEEHLLEDGKPPTIEDCAESTDKEDGGDLEPESQQRGSREYECKYCPFVTRNLNDFKDHVDSSHPYVILNPLYLCAPCNFNTKKFDSLSEHNSSQHPGETNFKFKRIKTNNQTVLEQTIESQDKSVEPEVGGGLGESGTGEVHQQGSGIKSSLDGLMQKNQITAVNINGTVIIPEPSILQGLSHVTPLLQLPPNINSVPKIAVPLNTTKYNPSLDDNLTLITSFNKFPYPTHAELSWLTAASKHPEEQIKVWFTTQRLKQGITWSPEEVEEARKKMFNGSIPPNHHTYTSQPLSPISAPSKQTVIHTTVEQPGQVRTTNGMGVGLTGSNSSAGGPMGFKRPLQSQMLATLGPESKRPIMAVAPHPGEPKDRRLMAPPPPPPPPNLTPKEMKRPPTAVPLLPPSPSSPSLLPKGKTLPTLGNTKTKPLVSLPSIVFPESLTRPMIAPPPIFGPPFKNSLLIPRLLPLGSKEKSPLNSHAFPASDVRVQNSPPHITPQLRRPAVIQSIHPPLKIAAPPPAFPLEGSKGLEQQGVDLKACYSRGDQILTPLTDTNGTSQADTSWVHNQGSVLHNNGVIHLDSDVPQPDIQQKSLVLTQFPLLERMKGKTGEQLKILEENFIRNSFPTQIEVDNLSATTSLSHQEIESWFVERRALRDNLEQALLNSMGTKRNGAGGLVASVEKQLQQTVKLNGIQKSSSGTGHLKAAAPPKQVQAMVPAPISNINSCLVPPDNRWVALLKGNIAQNRWPSPEEFSQLEGQTGPTRPDLAHWFNEIRPQTDGSVDHLGPFHGNVMNGGQRAPLRSSEKTHSSNMLQCQGGAVTNNVSSSFKMTEVEMGWSNGQRFTGLTASQLKDLHQRFSGRFDAPAGLLQKEGKRVME